MLKKGLQLCSRSPVPLRRTDKRTSQLPGSLRPHWQAFLSTTKFLRPEFTSFIAL